MASPYEISWCAAPCDEVPCHRFGTISRGLLSAIAKEPVYDVLRPTPRSRAIACGSLFRGPSFETPAVGGLLRMRSCFRGEILDPHGEERRLRRVSNHKAPLCSHQRVICDGPAPDPDITKDRVVLIAPLRASSRPGAARVPCEPVCPRAGLRAEAQLPVHVHSEKSKDFSSLPKRMRMGPPDWHDR